MSYISVQWDVAPALERLNLSNSKIKEVVMKTATTWKFLGVSEVQERTPVRTGALRRGYDEASTVTPTDKGAEIVFQSNVDYQPYVEARKPHLRPGVHASIPAAKQAFEDAVKEAVRSD
ncbi:MAG TPA: hypothetical protein PLQ01_05075 [Methanothrix sp.]|nr:hypothetical protein [Methanothrix sp.]